MFLNVIFSFFHAHSYSTHIHTHGRIRTIKYFKGIIEKTSCYKVDINHEFKL